MRGSVSSSSSSMGYAPTTHPPTPPTSVLGPNTGTLRSAASPYRTPAPPVNPPSVPANYSASHPLAGAGSMGPTRESGYAPGSASVQSTPPVRMLQQQTSGYGSPLPPPMHDISQRPYISGECSINQSINLYCKNRADGTQQNNNKTRKKTSYEKCEIKISKFLYITF